MHKKLLKAQQQQKKYADAKRQHREFKEGDKVLLNTKNLKLASARKLTDRFVGPFRVTERIGATAYRLDLSGSQRLGAIHNVFHVSLLRPWNDNGLGMEVPPIEVDGEDEYEVSCIKGHRIQQGETQFLTGFTGYDASEDMWLTEA